MVVRLLSYSIFSLSHNFTICSHWQYTNPIFIGISVPDASIPEAGLWRERRGRKVEKRRGREVWRGFMQGGRISLFATLKPKLNIKVASLKIILFPKVVTMVYKYLKYWWLTTKKWNNEKNLIKRLIILNTKTGNSCCDRLLFA